MGLKLEVGKYYKTRDGQKVGPLTYHSDEIESYRWQVEGLDLNGTVAAWFDSGAVYSTHTSPHDLIALWQEAPTGPVRTVTRTTREIVPGEYDGLDVGRAVNGMVFLAMPIVNHCQESIDAIIANLTAIRDALEGQ